MVITKSGDVTKEGFCKMIWRKPCLREGLLLSVIWVCVGGSGVGLGAYSRLGAYSNKYGIHLERRALLALCYWSAGTDLVVLTFQLLLDCDFFFLSCFLSFTFSLLFSIVFFRLIFRFSPQFHSPPPSPASPLLLQTRGNDHFVLLQIIPSTIPRSWLTQNCGLKDFLGSWKL